MASDRMVVGLCRLDLIIPASPNLKGKRQVIKSLVTRVRNNFNISVSEVGKHDKWQRALLGLSLVGNDRKFVDRVLSKAIDFIQASGAITIVDQEREIINY
ncbi:MAG: DUF503 domain-containing protein [Thermodesulfobacteriota bacterium]|jgi:hypothetical protein